MLRRVGAGRWRGWTVRGEKTGRPPSSDAMAVTPAARQRGEVTRQRGLAASSGKMLRELSGRLAVREE